MSLFTKCFYVMFALFCFVAYDGFGLRGAIVYAIPIALGLVVWLLPIAIGSKKRNVNAIAVATILLPPMWPFVLVWSFMAD